MSLIVVQPSADYAGRVLRHFPDAVFLAAPARAVLLGDHPRVVAADLDDPKAAHQALCAWARQQGVTSAGIVCFVCAYLPLAACLAHWLGLPFAAESTVRLTRDKSRTTAAWEAAGVQTPPTRLVQRLADLLDFAGVSPGPWILKPTDRSGSEWVLKIDYFSDLPQAHRRLQEGLEGAPYLAQTFLRGREFSADLYLEEGQVHLLRLTEKYLLSQPGLAGLVGAYFPPALDPATVKMLRHTFQRGAETLGIRRGIVMVDAILSGGVLHLLEMALRPGGDCLPDLGLHTTGYDPIRAACQAALGQRPELPDLGHPARLAALHLMTAQTGLISRICFDRLRAHPAVMQVEPYHLPGEALRCWEGSYDDRILAACLARYERPEDLPALIEELSGLVELAVEEDAEVVS